MPFSRSVQTHEFGLNPCFLKAFAYYVRIIKWVSIVKIERMFEK